MENGNNDRINNPEAFAIYVLKRYFMFAYFDTIDRNEMDDIAQTGWETAIENDFDMYKTALSLRVKIRYILKTRGFHYPRENSKSDKNRKWLQIVSNRGANYVFDKNYYREEKQNVINPL